MTVFLEDDLANCPVLTNWTITQGDRGPPVLSGLHAFHEGGRAIASRITMVDPLLGWAICAEGGYRLAGRGTGGVETSAWPREKSEGH